MPGSKRFSKKTRAQGAVAGFPRLLGERLCLDFVNTLDNRLGLRPEEFLRTYADVAWWGHHVGLLSEADVKRSLERGDDEPTWADELFARAIALRGTLATIFTAIAHGHDVDQEDLKALHAAYMHMMPWVRLVPQEGRYRWVWEPTDREVERLLWEVTRSGIDTLANDDLSRVRQCPGTGDCGGLFLDTSRNASRRWCSMEGCGSRVKMRRQYARQTKGETGSESRSNPAEA